MTWHEPTGREAPIVIHFVRHGLVHDPSMIIYGRLPRFGLGDEGRRQAAAAARVLRDRPIAAIYTSPLLRTRQTAQIIRALHAAVPLRVSKLLHEIHTPFQGRPRSEGEARDWDLYTGTGAGYEQPIDVLARTRRFVDAVRRTHPGQEVVAVTHGDSISFLALWAHGNAITPAEKAKFFPAPASISTFSFGGNGDSVAYHYEVPYPAATSAL